MIGVDYDLFWTLNPKSLKPFVKAFSLKSQHEDWISWQQGLYIRLAVASVMSKSVKYPTKPLMANKVKEKSPEEIQKQVKEMMLIRMKLLNSRFGKEE